MTFLYSLCLHRGTCIENTKDFLALSSVGGNVFHLDLPECLLIDDNDDDHGVNDDTSAGNVIVTTINKTLNLSGL